MPLTSAITPYDPEWPARYTEEENRLRPVFGLACLAFHHVGSTAVPGLSAKPEIDILIIVTSSDGLPGWAEALTTFGYRRGGDLSEGHHFFKRDQDGVRTHKLHVCRDGHAIIGRMLQIRDHLRTHKDDREAYQDLKFGLERDNTKGIAEYLQGKAPFLDNLYTKKIGE